MSVERMRIEEPVSIEEANKALMRDYLENFWNQGNTAAADRFVDPNVVLHDVLRQGQASGLEGLKQKMLALRKAMPDMYVKVEDMFAEGDKVTIRYTAYGTHRRTFQGIPATHKRWKLDAIAIARIVNGKMVEGWEESDQIGMMQQLGVIPSGALPLPMRWFIGVRGWMTARRQKKASR